MNSEAEETRCEDVEPHGDVKAEQRLPGKASAAYLGQDVHQATSGSLPVPTLVEPDAPPSQGAEPGEYPRRDSLESTTGRRNKQPTPKNNTSLECVNLIYKCLAHSSRMSEMTS